MSLNGRRLQTLEAAFRELVAGGKDELKPGDLADHFRDSATPMVFWQLRADFSALEAKGVIALNPATGGYRLAG